MKTFSVAVLCIFFAAVSVTAQLSMEELSAITEDFRVRFDALHEDKDEFLRFARVLIRAEMHGLNEATLINLGEARNEIDDLLTEIRTDIANAIIQPNANEQCLLNLVNAVLAEGRTAGAGMSSCAADKIVIKETLGDEFRTLTNTLQRIAQASSEYTLYTFAIHDSFNNPQSHVDWLETNYAAQVTFWDEVARPEAQDDLDNMEANRPTLVAENRACLDGVVSRLYSVLVGVRLQINLC